MKLSIDMRKGILFGFTALLALSLGYGQSVVSDQDAPREIRGIGQERIFVHYSSPLFFVGEYMYYKIYCLNSKTNELSSISKIAYLQLIGENGKVLFKQKIRMEDGLGQGDFFIPVSVPSGNYKLVAYTNWMKNWGQEHFFQGDITIINPYSNNQTPFMSIQESQSKNPSKNIYTSVANNGINDNLYTKTDLNLSILGGKEFGKRQEVTLVLQSSKQQTFFGHYSLSIRKVNDYNTAKIPTADSFFKEGNWIELESFDQGRFFLPELRGDLVQGRVITKDSISGLPDALVSLSIPGENYMLKIGKTDSQGSFYFNLDKPYDKDIAFLQVLANDNANYLIQVESDSTNLNHKDFVFHDFQMSSEMDSSLLKRSIHNQIENVFFQAKPDTLFLQEKSLFYGDDAKTYLLDDYTRFPTLQETIVEILDGVWTQRDENGELNIKVREFNKSEVDFKYQPLIIVDGLIVQNHNAFLSYNPGRIESIRVFRKNYRLGAQMFQGILDVRTFDSHYLNNIGAVNVMSVNLRAPLPKKKYFQQVYNDSVAGKRTRIPDLRYQLLWLPDLKFKEEKKTISFFTSDVVGEFEIRLEGFTKEGKPISLRRILVVK